MDSTTTAGATDPYNQTTWRDALANVNRTMVGTVTLIKDCKDPGSLCLLCEQLDSLNNGLMVLASMIERYGSTH